MKGRENVVWRSFRRQVERSIPVNDDDTTNGSFKNDGGVPKLQHLVKDNVRGECLSLTPG